ncbi:hypothetical protein IPF86_03985 [Candidatus Nomurabacteria bacterium]|jgi:hypothetical protein|nr:MAG: hypothetical protein IPF86_03985 [Candidatus Nomurabacteria bacterium]
MIENNLQLETNYNKLQSQRKIGSEVFGDSDTIPLQESLLAKFVANNLNGLEYRKVIGSTFAISKPDKIFPSILIDLSYNPQNPDDSYITATLRRESGLPKDFKVGDQEIFYFDDVSIENLMTFLNNHMNELKT